MNTSFRRLHVSAALEWADYGCGGAPAQVVVEEETPVHEIVFVRRGAFDLEVDGRRWFVDAGRVVFLNAAVPYRVRHPVPGGESCTVLRLSSASIHSLDPERDPERPFRDTVSPSRLPIHALQGALHRHLEEGAQDPLAVEEGAALLCRGLLSTGGPPRSRAVRASRRELAEEARRLLHERQSQKVLLGDLACALGVSPFHLAHVFREVTGSSLHRTLVRLRLCTALELLGESRGDLTRLALRTGFSSHAHFTDQFRREFGQPPSRFRRAQLRECVARLWPRSA